MTVVFERPPSPPITSRIIEIAHAPRAAANSADDEIVRLVQADQDPQHLTVVTSDSALAERVHSAGASTQPASSFRDLIDPVGLTGRLISRRFESVRSRQPSAQGCRESR